VDTEVERLKAEMAIRKEEVANKMAIHKQEDDNATKKIELEERRLVLEERKLQLEYDRMQTHSFISAPVPNPLVVNTVDGQDLFQL
jgi:hypothetical protein